MRRTLFQNAAQTMLLDCSRHETFVITMGTSVHTLLLENISPGMLYVFVLRQDHRGSHKMNWGGIATNGVPLDPTPNSTTVQTFIGDNPGILEANTAGAWSEP